MSFLLERGAKESSASASELHKDAQTYSSSLFAGTASIIVRGSGKGDGDVYYKDSINITNLPVGVLLKIISYSDVRSTCRLCITCSYLNCIASDTLIWRRMLQRDIRTWKVIGHLAHPLLYHQTTSNLPPKAIYRQCYVHREGAPSSQSFTYPFTSRLRSLVQRLQGHVPKVILFGSGLESLPFVRKLFWEQESPYAPIGLYPGKDGVGSGVCIQHGSRPLNLVTLYTATKAERLTRQTNSDKKINKLISSYCDQNSPELTRTVQSLCQEADAFILVIDTSNLDSVVSRDVDTALLDAMLRSSTLPHTPLLVLATSLSSDSAAPQTPPPIQVAEWLSLVHIHHPWQVRTISLTTFTGLHDGLNWLLQAAQL